MKRRFKGELQTRKDDNGRKHLVMQHLVWLCGHLGKTIIWAIENRGRLKDAPHRSLKNCGQLRQDFIHDSLWHTLQLMGTARG